MSSRGKWLLSAGGALGAGLAAWWLLPSKDREIKGMVPDDPHPAPGKTGFKRIDAILDKLGEIARATGIPLGLLVGWIAKESGGKIAVHPQPGKGDTSLDERGYFQLTPDESRMLGLDHQRLSTDPDYSLAAGVKLIRHYQSVVNDLGVPAGSAFYWRLVKLAHSMGSGQVKKVFKAAQADGQASSWRSLQAHALGQKIRGPQPKKWFPFVDDSDAPTEKSSVYRVGAPFGFGSEDAAVVGYHSDPSKTGLDNLLTYADEDTQRKRGLVGLDVFSTRRVRPQTGRRQMRARRRQHSSTWVVDGGGTPGNFPGGRSAA